MNMQACEMAGPGPHDGMSFEVPESVIATILITREPSSGRLQGTCGVSRSANIDSEDLANLLYDMAEMLEDREETVA